MSKPALLLLSVCISLVVAVCSCKPEADSCFEPRNVAMRIHTYQVNDTSLLIADTIFTGANELLLHPINSANPVYYVDSGLSIVGVALDVDTNQTSYVIQTSSPAGPDTVSFVYDRSLQFLSNSCGYTYFFNLQSVQTTHHVIDSVVIGNPVVNNNISTSDHVKIYF